MNWARSAKELRLGSVGYDPMLFKVDVKSMNFDLICMVVEFCIFDSW